MKNNVLLPLPRPSIAEIVIAACVSIARANLYPRRSKVISEIGPYHLIEEVNKNIFFKNFSIGIYASKDEKVFIKTWRGNIKDSNYYLLLNEYNAGVVLYNKFKKLQQKYHILIPKVISCYKTHTSLSVVFEYVPGKQLNSYPEGFQTETLEKILACLNEISSLLTEDEKKVLRTQDASFYILSVFPLIAFALLVNKSHIKALTVAIWRIFSSIHDILKQPLALAHGDLNAENVLMNGATGYLIDEERISLTLPGYDATHLSIIPDAQNIRASLLKKTAGNINPFLKKYLTLAAIVNTNHIPEYKRYYLNTLLKMYE